MNIMNFNILSLVENIKNFFGSLTTIDIIFFFAVLLLMILLVTLLYFIKSNEDYVDDNQVNTNQVDHTLLNEKNKIISNNVEEKKENILPTTLNNVNEYNDEETELIDLKSITKALENKEVNAIDLTTFEEEQERDAIISYDELLRKSSPSTFSYKKETMIDDVSVKEIDLDSLNNPQLNNKVEEKEIKSISYEEEEAFLEALKSLQKSLN